jgi:hypothetical protein
MQWLASSEQSSPLSKTKRSTGAIFNCANLKRGFASRPAKPQVALDAVGAGVGELVFWCRGKEASFPFKRDSTPTDCTIVGIVDSDSPR